MKETSIQNGKVSKNSPLIHFLGTLDELNSHLGLVKALAEKEDTKKFIETIQNNLMLIMSHINEPENEKFLFNNDSVIYLKNENERLKNMQPEIHEFIIPGQNIIEAQIHIARTVARKTERYFYSVCDTHPLCKEAGEYLNKLSEYLFFLSFQC